MNPRDLQELPKNLLERAIFIATVAHDGQVDKSGVPYILHPLRVMARGKTIEERVCGVLHDVIEDTSVTLTDLKAYGIPHHMVDAIECLSRKYKAETYHNFIGRILTNEIAMRVKLHDLDDNQDPNRAIGGKEYLGMMRKYNRARRRILDQIHDGSWKVSRG